MLLEKEKSNDYLDRAKLFLTNYEPEKKELDAAAKKEVLGLVFKKIIIKSLRNARPHPRVSPVFYEPFGKIHTKSPFLLKERGKCKGILLKPMAATWTLLYHKLKSVLEFIYKDQI